MFFSRFLIALTILLASSMFSRAENKLSSEFSTKSEAVFGTTTDTTNFENTRIHCSSEKFKLKSLIAPGALIVAGTILSLDNDHGINKSATEWFQGSHQTKIDNYLRYTPSAAYILLGIAGVKAKHSFKERLAVFATSHACMLALGYGTKAMVSEQRPDQSDYSSFPSGHTAVAFTGAELLREEYGTAYGIGGYVIATSVAVLRLYNQKHWLNDVLMGAGIGILSARVGYWMLPLEKKWFGWDKKESKTMMSTIPIYDFTTKSVGLSLVAQF